MDAKTTEVATLKRTIKELESKLKTAEEQIHKLKHRLRRAEKGD